MPISVLTREDFRPRPYAEAAKALAVKVPVAAEVFAKLHAETKRRAFTLGQIHKARLLQQAQNIVTRAAEHGTPIRTVMRELTGLLKRGGVSGLRIGRLRQAVRGNVLTAYSTARKATLDQPHILEAFPYRQKLTVGNGQPGVNGVRPTHAVFHGKVFKADDAFWDFFAGNWEYGCRCFDRPLTEGQVRAMRCVIWTYTGGGIVPADVQLAGKPGKRQGLGVAARPNPDFSGDVVEFDLSAINEELRRAVEETLARK